MTLPRILVIMGSGETAPTMVKVHRAALDRLGRSNVCAVMLDTPFGFQENADELCAKSIEYFSVSLQTELSIASLRSAECDSLAIEQGLQRLRSATYLFAGPGSPTYALRQWQAIPAFTQTLGERLHSPGAVVFSSAASLTLGTRTVPVYEIYKAGEKPHWLPGLDVLGDILPGAVIIPHFDNAEGGGHDTRFCYLGETRLNFLEAELDPDEYVFGIDEHTAAVFDLDADTLEVVGKGAVTIRRSGTSRRFEAGVLSPISAYFGNADDAEAGRQAITLAAVSPSATSPLADSGADVSSSPTLAAATQVCAQTFRAAIDNRDANGAAAATLALDDAMFAWASDPGHNDHPEQARAALRSFIVQLGAAANVGLVDPDEAVRPLLDVILKLRSVVRSEKRFDMSDLIRDELGAINFEVRDTPQGAVWSRR